jgi:hypothetical protein
MEPMRKCALALDPNDDDSCWCWQKARAVADALDELAHNEKVAKERAAATCPFDNRDHGLQPEDPCPVCGDMGISDAPWTGKCVSDKKTVIA